MYKKFSATGDQTLVAPTDTAITIQSATTIRPAIAEFSASMDAPADNQILVTVQLFDTDDGTGTAVTPKPLIDGFPAALGVIQDNHTVEPSSYLSGEIWYAQYFNARATLRWVAVPGFEWVLPAVATEGAGWLPSHASNTDDINVTVYWSE